MSHKMTINQIKELFIEYGLTVLDNESKGVDYKYKCIDKDGYLFSKSVHSLERSIKQGQDGKSHAFSIKNPYYYDNMLNYINKTVNNGTRLLTDKKDIKSVKQQLKFKCGICGREYSSTWHTFIKTKNKICNFCFNQLKSKGEVGVKSQETNKFHLAALQNGLSILSGPDLKYHEKVLVQDKEGYKGLTTPDNILKGGTFERFSKSNPYTIDNIRIYALHKGWDCVIYNQEYKGDKSPIKILCSCGNEFEVDVTHFVNGKYKCNQCRIKQSAIASKVELWLNINHIDYIKEKIFKDCMNIKCLPFDFYLPKYNACIEVDGIGHYRPVAFSGDKEQAKSQYIIRVKNDNIKTNYCKDNKIPLLRLPFWEIEKDDFQTRLKNFILSIEPNELNK